MNISPDGVTVRFKTEPEERFLAEKSGVKPNTVRIIDAYEADLIRRNPPTRIIIHNPQESFLRTLTDIHLNYGILGKVLVIFSWTHEKPHHSMPYEPSLEERFPTIIISEGTLALLQSIAHGRTMDMVIKELYERYRFQRLGERGPLHD